MSEMRPIDAGRPRSPLDDAIMGKPLIDRFGMTWWLVHNRSPLDRVHRLVCAPTSEMAHKGAGDSVRYLDLQKICGPLRAGELP